MEREIHGPGALVGVVEKRLYGLEGQGYVGHFHDVPREYEGHGKKHHYGDNSEAYGLGHGAFGGFDGLFHWIIPYSSCFLVARLI